MRFQLKGDNLTLTRKASIEKTGTVTPLPYKLDDRRSLMALKPTLWVSLVFGLAIYCILAWF